MREADRLAEMRRLHDEALQLCDKAAELGRAMAALAREETGDVQPRPHRRRRPSYLTVVKGIIGGGIAAVGLRKLVAGAAVTGVTTAAMVTGLVLLPPVVATPPKARAAVAAPRAHGRRQDPSPAATPAPQVTHPAVPQPSLPSASPSATVTPGVSVSAGVQIPVPLPSVSICVPLPLHLCIAA